MLPSFEVLIDVGNEGGSWSFSTKEELVEERESFTRRLRHVDIIINDEALDCSVVVLQRWWPYVSLGRSIMPLKVQRRRTLPGSWVASPIERDLGYEACINDWSQDSDLSYVN